MNNQSLNNLIILNTRPTHQADGLNQLLTTLGGKIISYPTIEIIPTDNITTQWDHFDIAIFVSANAVHFSIKKQGFSNISVIAIGPGTANALKQYGISNSIIPEQYNSEGILSLKKLENIDGKSIIIFCGENTRPLLKETLKGRGAKVTLAECYRRRCPKINEQDKQALLKQTINIIISTSKESLNNLCAMIGNDKSLLKIPLLVISPSMKTLAENQGWQTIICAPNASDQAVLDTLCDQVANFA